MKTAPGCLAIGAKEVLVKYIRGMLCCPCQNRMLNGNVLMQMGLESKDQCSEMVFDSFPSALRQSIGLGFARVCQLWHCNNGAP